MKKKKKKTWPKVVISLIVIIVLGLSIAYAYVHSKLSKMEKVEIDKSNIGVSSQVKDEFTQSDKIRNIALYGIDAPQGETGRSDTIMIATVDPVHKKLKLTSIMRDSYVSIQGYGLDKINHAYAYGGPELALKTLNENFGLNITEFMTVNFSSLPTIINALDGVKMTITDEEVPHINGIPAAGTYNLTGEQSLDFSRIRYAEGDDYKRTERQRDLLDAIFQKALTLPATSYLGVLDKISPYIQTNMSSTDILSLGTKALTSFGNELQQERYPLNGYCEDLWLQNDSGQEIYYLSFDAETVKKQIMNYIFDDVKIPEQ